AYLTGWTRRAGGHFEGRNEALPRPGLASGSGLREALSRVPGPPGPGRQRLTRGRRKRDGRCPAPTLSQAEGRQRAGSPLPARRTRAGGRPAPPVAAVFARAGAAD